MPKIVTPSMPLKTAMPSDLPHLGTGAVGDKSGTTPRMNAIEVMMIGRSRSRHASSVASRIGLPDRRITLANSTIRIAFLLARPTSTTRPIWVKMLISSLRRVTPRSWRSRCTRGTDRITASGIDQLSNWAASTRNTITIEKAKTMHGRVAGLELEVGQLGPFEGHRLGQLVRGELLDISSIAWPELTPGAGVAVDRGRRIHVVPGQDQRAVDLVDLGHRPQRAPSSRSRCAPAAG